MCSAWPRQPPGSPCPSALGRAADPARRVARRHTQAPAPLARVQPARQVHGRPARSRSRNATSPTSPSWASTSSGCRWITAAGPTRSTPESSRNRSSRRSTRPSSSARSTASTSRSTSTGPRVHRRQARGAEIALDRPRDPGRLRRPLGGLRGAVPGHAEQPGQLQPAQRARRQGQAGGSPPRGRARSPRRSASATRSG